MTEKVTGPSGLHRLAGDDDREISLEIELFFGG